MRYAYILFLLYTFFTAQGQVTPSARRPRTPDYKEFNDRMVLPIEGGMGFVSQGSRALFSLQASPQLTVPHWCRIGATIGAAYTAIYAQQDSEDWTGYIGPKVSFKLDSFGFNISGVPNALNFANLNLFVEHLWASNFVRLAGIGLTGEVAKTVAVSLKIHRDYNHDATWAQLGLSINLVPQREEESFQKR